VTATIGTSGGTLSHPAGAKLVIPAGALTSDTTITLTGIDAPANDVLGATAVGQGFVAGPDGLTFAVPVAVTLPFDATKMAAGTSASSLQMLMAPSNATTKGSFAALDTQVDLTAGAMTAQTLHFTQFVPAQSSNPIFVTTASLLPTATATVAYTTTLAATGGTAPFTWSLPAGSSLPPGLSLSTSGTISGTPTAASVYSFFVEVTDATPQTVQKAFTLPVGSPPTPPNPVPTVGKISPNTANQGDPATTITITGTGFVQGMKGVINGSGAAITFVSATQATMVIPQSLLATAGTLQIGVENPGPGGGLSNTLPFTINAVMQNPVPVLTSIAPTNAPAGSPDTQITITGSQFLSSSFAIIGQQQLSTSFQSSTQLFAVIPSSFLATAGTLSVQVFTPTPGGGTSQSATFTVTGGNPTPVVSLVQPNSTPAGSGSFTIGVAGSNFVSGAVVFFGQTSLVTTFVSATALTATVPANLVATAGTFLVTVHNPGVAQGSNAVDFFVTIAPDGGVDASTDAAVDATVGDAASDAATDAPAEAGPDATVDASTDAPADAVPPTVADAVADAAPVDAGTVAITSVRPNQALAGSGDLPVTLMSSGAFVNPVTVTANGVPCTIDSQRIDQVVAVIPSSQLSAAGTVTLVATNADSTFGTATFTVVTTGNALPVLTSISPSSTPLGTNPGKVVLTGTNFLQGAQVWFGATQIINPPPQLVSSTELDVFLPASVYGYATVTTAFVVNPTPGGGASFPRKFGISGSNPPPSIQSISPTTVGQGTVGVNFTITSTPVGGFTTGTTIRLVNGTDNTTETFTCSSYATSCVFTPSKTLASAGTVTVTASTPGQTSGQTTFTVQAGSPTPVLTSTNPSMLVEGATGVQQLTIYGYGIVSSGIAPTQVFEVNSHTQLQYSAMTPQSITVLVPSNLVAPVDGGSPPFDLQLVNPGAGTGAQQSASVHVDVLPAPWLTSVAPSPLSVNAFTMTLTGANLDLTPLSGPGTAYVIFGGGTGPTLTPTNVTATQWTVDVAAGALTAGSTTVQVYISGYPYSNAINVSVQ
jgi:hypothetical protein